MPFNQNSLRKRTFSSSSSTSPKRKIKSNKKMANDDKNAILGSSGSFSVSPVIQASSSPRSLSPSPEQSYNKSPPRQFRGTREFSPRMNLPPKNPRRLNKNYGMDSSAYNDRRRWNGKDENENYGRRFRRENNHFRTNEDRNRPFRGRFRGRGGRRQNFERNSNAPFMRREARPQFRENFERDANRPWRKTSKESDRFASDSRSRSLSPSIEIDSDESAKPSGAKAYGLPHSKKHHRSSDGVSFEREGVKKTEFDDPGKQFLNYKDFLLRQRDDITPEEAQKLYEQYKKEFKLSNTKVFFDRHKDEEWFLEKYSPSVRLSSLKRQLETSKKMAKLILDELNLFKNRSDKESEAKRMAFADKHNLFRDKKAFEIIRDLEKEIQIKDENEKIVELERRLREEQRKQDLLSESSSEEEPLQKNTALQKTNTTSIKTPEKPGFAFSPNFGKHLSSLGRNIARKSQLREDSLYCDEDSVFLSTIPLKLKRRDLEEVFEKLEGFRKMCLSEPIPKYNMNRFAWVTFDSQENCRKALELNGHKITYSESQPPLYLHILPKKKSYKSVPPAPFTTLLESQVESDMEAASKLIDLYNERKGIPADKGMIDSFDSKIAQLNLLIFFLRAVHSFCYYCGCDYGSEEGLMSRCTKNHPRNSIVGFDSGYSELDASNESRTRATNPAEWLVEHEGKLKKAMETDASEEILNWTRRMTEKYIDEHSEVVAKERHCCKECRKMFMGRKFLVKHIQNKHGDAIAKFLGEAEENAFFENYANDAGRFQLENVEAVIPGDTTASFSFGGYKSNANPRGSTPRGTQFANSNQRRNFNPSQLGRGHKFANRTYVDLDKPPGDGEMEIDYGFAADTMPMFNL